MSRTKRNVNPHALALAKLFGGDEYITRLGRGHCSQSGLSDAVVDGDQIRRTWRDVFTPEGKRFCKRMVRRARRRTEFASYEAGEFDW
jgi:hypothetical protein